MTRSNSRSVYEILGRNSVHPFPARMAPGLALDVVAACKDPLRILDPMSGSGTVLAVARLMGHKAVGIDIDPLAVLISRVWTTQVDAKAVQERANNVLEIARRTFVSLRTRDAYPMNSDDETRRFVRYWFDDYARRQLTSLAAVIPEVQDAAIRDALWCAFSRLIITKRVRCLARRWTFPHTLRRTRIFKRATSTKTFSLHLVRSRSRGRQLHP